VHYHHEYHRGHLFIARAFSTTVEVWIRSVEASLLYLRLAIETRREVVAVRVVQGVLYYFEG
jgi:hypothetical protein